MISIRYPLGLAIACLLAAAADARAADTACKFYPGSSTRIFLGVQSQSIKIECEWQNQSLTRTAHVIRADLTTRGLLLAALTAGSPVNPQVLLVSKTLKPELNQVGVNANRM
jgi:hypothetical protein